VTAAPAEARFFSRTFDETLGLLTAARDYFSYAYPAAERGLAPAERMRLSCESMRITARLSQVMAWLLAQRAAFAGEISRAEAASDKFSLGAPDICLLDTDRTLNGLPERLRDLLGKSRQLYVRVARLDEMNRRAITGAFPATG
jgi:regulator of CtrA degradation